MRAYHSASSMATGDRCQRLWFYDYVAEVPREPEYEWSAIAHYVSVCGPDGKRNLWRDAKTGHTIPGRSRSTSLGKAMHSIGESWYISGGAGVDWESLPGRIFLSGAHLLPHPTRVHAGAIEQGIGNVPFTKRPGRGHDPDVVLDVNGVRWSGLRDLVAQAPEEYARLGVDAPNGWALLDYKSSKDIIAYALRGEPDAFAKVRSTRFEWPGLLREDFQANLYTFATCEEKQIDVLPCRWVYFATGEKRESYPVDAMITYDAAREQVIAASERAKALDRIEREDQAPMNLDACSQYGGCPHHKSAGGPCSAQRSLGSLIKASALVRPRSKSMGSIADRFKGIQGGDTTAPAGAEGADAPAADPAPAAAAPARGRGRPKKATEPTAAAPPPADANTFEKQITLPGEHAPIRIIGDARDLVDVASLIMNAS